MFQSARAGAMSREEYVTHALPHDLRIFERIAGKTWLNMLHLCKPGLYFDVARHFPVQAVNWHDRGRGGPSLAEARKLFDGSKVAAKHVDPNLQPRSLFNHVPSMMGFLVCDPAGTECDNDADCPDGYDCVGATACPEGAYCILPPSPGTCQPVEPQEVPGTDLVRTWSVPGTAGDRSAAAAMAHHVESKGPSHCKPDSSGS